MRILYVVDNPNLTGRPLSHDDRHLVVPAQISDGVYFSERVIRNISEPASDLRIHNFGCVDGTFHGGTTFAFPDIVVVVL